MSRQASLVLIWSGALVGVGEGVESVADNSLGDKEVITLPNRFGFGRGGGGWGMGYGFRGSSPPWPYVGLGRGGLPRCGYFLSRVARAPSMPGYWQPPYPPSGVAVPFYGSYSPGGMAGTPFAPQMTREEELGFLKSQAEAIKGQLEQIESRVRELESQAES